MQRGFINSIKKGYKSIKQDVKGADIYDAELIKRVIEVGNKALMPDTDVSSAELGLSTVIYTKNFFKKYRTYGLNVKKTNVIINSKNFEAQYGVDKIDINKLGQFDIIYKEIKDYDTFYTETLDLGFEGFETSVLSEEIEKIKKSKILNLKNIVIKEKILNGRDIIYKIPKRFYGRSFIGKKEMIDIAVKVKEARPDFDFTSYRFQAIFEELPVNYMNKFKYLDDTKELEFYFDKKAKDKLGNMSLVVWSHKSRPVLEKIFI